jgi:hypothetical protein
LIDIDDLGKQLIRDRAGTEARQYPGGQLEVASDILG